MARNQIGVAYVQIRPSMEGVAPTVRNYFGATGNSAGSLFGVNFANRLKTFFVSAGIGEALKKTLTEGASLEQSLGGIETLFKESAATVIANAEQAYKTAGTSANGYMEQVTSFSASLLQSLGGDTAKAADIANMAMIDMSDNANKMGTDMQRITDAYQGFAKQNYTMLDNLKLGYGGTKTEMERLLADAQKLTGVKYDIDNLSDVYSAIHAIQEELDITGTTAKEAASTLTGSFNSMKAAFTDVLGNMTLGFDVGPSLNALTSTTVTFLQDNLIPAVKNVLTELPTALSTFIKGVLPANMTETAVSMVNSLALGLDSSVPQLLSRALPIITEFTGNLRNNAGMLMDAGLNLITNLGQGFINALPSLVSNVPTIIMNICGLINDNAPKLLQTGIELIIQLGKGILQAGPTILENIPEIIDSIMAVFSAANWVSLGSKMLKSISNGAKAASPSNVAEMVRNLLENLTKRIQEGFPVLVEKGTQMLINLVSGLKSGIPNLLMSATSMLGQLFSILSSALPMLMSNGVQFISHLASGFITSIPNFLTAAGSLLNQLLQAFITALPSVMASGASLIANLVGGILSNLPAVVSSGATIIADLLSEFAAHLPDLLAQGISLMGNLIAGLLSAIPDILSAAGNIIENIINEFGETDWLQVGKDIISGIAEGIRTAASKIIDAAREAAQRALQAAKDALGIKSPSRRFKKEVGYQMSAGAALGVYDGIPLVKKAIDTMSDAGTATFTSRLRIGTQFQKSGNSNSGTDGLRRSVIINQYIYSEAKTAADLMQEARYQAEKAVLFGV